MSNLPKYKIFDIAFAHSECSCHNAKLEEFAWDRSLTEFDTAWFVDTCLQDIDKVPPSTRKIAWLLEPPEIMLYSYEFVLRHLSHFDYVLTHQRKLCQIAPGKILWYPHGGIWIAPQDRKVWPKTRSVSIIVSEKRWTEGQRLRHQIVDRFGSQIDVFGRGYRPIDDKGEALRDYRYSIVIENSRSEGYFSEKLLDCLAVGTIPIYWGDPKICQDYGFHPNDGIINISEMVHIERFLQHLNEYDVGQYNLSLERGAIQHNFDTAMQYATPEAWMWKNYPFLFKENT